MNDTVAMFLVIMTAMVLTSLLLLVWIRTRGHVKVAGSSLESSRQVELISNENAALKGQVGRLEERIAVLERIATDPAERTARAIDQLR